MLRAIFFLIMIIFIFSLNGCGKKGPVRPIDTSSSTVQTDIDKAPDSYFN